MHRRYRPQTDLFFGNKEGLRISTEHYFNLPVSYHHVDALLELEDGSDWDEFINFEIPINGELLDIPENIREIVLELTTYSAETIIDHFDRHNQERDRMLFIICYGNQRDQSAFDELLSDLHNGHVGPFSENIKIMSVDEYIDLFRIEGDYAEYLQGLDLEAGLAQDSRDTRSLEDFSLTNRRDRLLDGTLDDWV